jgi:hypothetical protein
MFHLHVRMLHVATLFSSVGAILPNEPPSIDSFIRGIEDPKCDTENDTENTEN